MTSTDQYKLFKKHVEQLKNEESDSIDQVEHDYNNYKLLLELWKSENPIKTNKLQVLLVVNGLLVSSLQIAGGFIAANWALYLAGAFFSIVWVLSIGRTSLYQKYWQEKLGSLQKKHENDSRFNIVDVSSVQDTAPWWLKTLGSISSKYYLLGAPVIFSIFWIVAFIVVCSK